MYFLNLKKVKKEIDESEKQEDDDDFDIHKVRIIPLFGGEKRSTGQGEEKNQEFEPEIPIDY